MIEQDQQTFFNPWQYKPWWCQPWTIILTGMGAIAVSWLLFQRLWLTLPLSFVIVIWWLYFLILWPRLLQQLYREQSESDRP
ncbi:MAG: DUF6737 family protein [Snowella sp.]|nr:DUF6737 family protein [Snowella sp.]